MAPDGALPAAAALPPETGCQWIAPSCTTRAKWMARRFACSPRWASVMGMPSASTPVHMVDEMCMFQVNAVAPQKRPISAATIM